MNHQCKFNFIYFWLWCQTQRPLISNPEGKQCWCIWTAICLSWGYDSFQPKTTKECWYLSFWATSSWFKKGSCQLLAKYVSKVLVNCIEEGVWLSEAKVSCILLHRGVQLILAKIWGRPANLVSCILLHRGIQLILANSWGMPANLAVAKSRGGVGGEYFYFFCFFTFNSFPLSPLFLSFISSTISSIFSFSLGNDTKWPTRVDVSFNQDTINQKLHRGLSLPRKKCEVDWPAQYDYNSVDLAVNWIKSKCPIEVRKTLYVTWIFHCWSAEIKMPLHAYVPSNQFVDAGFIAYCYIT